MQPPILALHPLGFQWPTVDPFLFCVHHDDPYPKGNGNYGPAASLAGHPIGQDFDNPDGWRMYHGETVPGFPSHPHRGFETVTLVRRGLIDHSDSLGAAARFGRGDAQWLTAGRGIVHAEMFPLLETQAANPLELFQIWLNLPARNKFAAPYFTMFWAEDMPRFVTAAPDGARTEVVCVAGPLDANGTTITPLPPPPDSWASAPDSDLAIWTLKLDAGARWTLPPARSAATRRLLYFFAGNRLRLGDQTIDRHCAIEVRADQALPIASDGAAAELLMLQGRPIGEPVAQYGPFVMNTEREIQQAFADYRATQFGGWPWAAVDPVHGPDPTRFARHVDGRVDRREG